MEHFISLLFLARDVAHREHLRTRSFAAHIALNDFYHEIIEQADGITEAYQGSYQLLNQNLIDGIMETYFTVLYKLRFLK
jgi:hypothetical protein